MAERKCGADILVSRPKKSALRELPRSGGERFIAVIGEKLHATFCELYDKETNKWVTLPLMTTIRYSYPSVIVHEIAGRHRIVIFGGFDGEDYPNSCEYLDIGDDKWTLVEAKMSMPRCASVAVLLDHTTVVVCGGSYKGNTLNSCESFDTATQTFSFFPNMLEFRYCHAALFYNDSIVVIGGFNGRCLTSCEKFDRDKNKWVSFPSLNQARSGSSVAVIDGKIFVAGGQLMNSVECFDGVSWTIVATLYMSSYCRAIGSFEGKIIIFEEPDRIDMYDLTTTTRSTLPPMEKTSHNCLAISF